MIPKTKVSRARKPFLNFRREKQSTQPENLPPDLMEAINDSRERKNLHGSFDSAEEAVKAMLED